MKMSDEELINTAKDIQQKILISANNILKSIKSGSIVFTPNDIDFVVRTYEYINSMGVNIVVSEMIIDDLVGIYMDILKFERRLHNKLNENHFTGKYLSNKITEQETINKCRILEKSMNKSNIKKSELKSIIKEEIKSILSELNDNKISKIVVNRVVGFRGDTDDVYSIVITKNGKDIRLRGSDELYGELGIDKPTSYSFDKTVDFVKKNYPEAKIIESEFDVT